jgi:hypothetical protein
MGMFDNIECNYPLPISKELIELDNFDIYEVELQTKSLDNLMELYVITEDGELFRKKNQYEWVDDDNAFLKGYMEVVSSDLVKENFHGIIEFGCFHSIIDVGEKTTETSISVDYEAKFIDGKLVSIELVRQSIEDTTEYFEKMQALFKEQKRKAKLWYNKYIFYTKWFRTVKRHCIYKPLNGLHKFTGKLLTLSYRI